ncbi:MULTISPECIES: FkbM family methyltransferase [unclassified Mesorhizobium]|uniref:FkbM family methyltransferase n=1 Tax=unclassified Mesorhizobium TaxID=325217 RepID=UPI001FD9BF91|nr:FkbM family methyltransferase [Mesorhizobium sp. L2C067A000]
MGATNLTGVVMLRESYFEFMLRWYAYRRWHRPPRRVRQAEYDFHQLMKKLPADSLFIDLGANIGDVTGHVLAYGMRVIAFEPDPVARQILTTRFGNNDRVTIIPKAVGGSARTATFHQRPDVSDLRRTESSSLIQTHEHTNGKSFEVEVVDLVQFLQGLHEPIAIVKMDIEGAEAECIEAMLDAGIHRSIGQILVETHERFSPDLADRIGKLRGRIAQEGIRNINLDWS